MVVEIVAFIDAHIHLYSEEYHPRLQEILEEAYRRRVRTLICAAEDYETSLQTLQISSQWRGFVYPVIGVHPWSANQSLSDLEDTLSLILKYRDRLAGIGETGLDRKYAGEEGEWRRQLEAFKAMIEASEKTSLPLVIHSRKSVDTILEVLESSRVGKALFHWFSGDEGSLRKIIDMGYFVSFTPTITYSKRMQGLASRCDPSKVLSETDGPVPFYGKYKGVLTTPVMVIDVVEKLAEIFSKSLEEMAEQIMDNAEDLFKLGLKTS